MGGAESQGAAESPPQPANRGGKIHRQARVDPCCETRQSPPARHTKVAGLQNEIRGHERLEANQFNAEIGDFVTVDVAGNDRPVVGCAGWI